MSDQQFNALKHTQLHAKHVALGAKMVPFAGYDMPVQYPMGVLKEHLHTRISACLLYTSPSPRDLSTSRMPSSA